MRKLTDHSFFHELLSKDPMDEISGTIGHIRGTRKKRGTDAFQVFCMKNRADLSAQNPSEPVGSITSRLAQLWRSMNSDQKSIYVAFARQFDQAPPAPIRPTKSRCREPPEFGFLLPKIHVIQRGESGAGAAGVSFDSLARPGEAHMIMSCAGDEMRETSCDSDP
jgi:hypothetical protein